jgi:hypothetical protein
MKDGPFLEMIGLPHTLNGRVAWGNFAPRLPQIPA